MTDRSAIVVILFIVAIFLVGGWIGWSLHDEYRSVEIYFNGRTMGTLDFILECGDHDSGMFSSTQIGKWKITTTEKGCDVEIYNITELEEEKDYLLRNWRWG